ncbi:MAG TPA: PilZ domain-containing protein [Bryobacteraceae bacterium]|nr:PilZ domain-containing protein [Bryobacteraceae bacterium]
MDQRREARLAVDEKVVLRVLDCDNQGVPALIVDRSAGGLGIRLDTPLKPGVMVEIRGADSILLGEVVYCREEQGGAFLGTRIEHGLFGLAELHRVASEFLTQPGSETAIMRG